MISKTSLRNTFDEFITDGRSGIVALSGNPREKDSLEYVIYFNCLNIVYVVNREWGSEYFDADAHGFLERVLDEFAERDDVLTLDDLGLDVASFLQTNLAGLLWHMVHDYDDIPSDYDDEGDIAKVGLSAPDSLVSDPGGDSFTLFGSTDLEADIRHFHEIALCDGEFSIGEDGFSIGTSEDESGKTVYSLGCQFDSFFHDDSTGEKIPVITTNYLLHNYDWRNLYARTRAFVRLNCPSRGRPYPA